MSTYGNHLHDLAGFGFIPRAVLTVLATFALSLLENQVKTLD